MSSMLCTHTHATPLDSELKENHTVTTTICSSFFFLIYLRQSVCGRHFPSEDTVLNYIEETKMNYIIQVNTHASVSSQESLNSLEHQNFLI